MEEMETHKMESGKKEKKQKCDTYHIGRCVAMIMYFSIANTPANIYTWRQRCG